MKTNTRIPGPVLAPFLYICLSVWLSIEITTVDNHTSFTCAYLSNRTKSITWVFLGYTKHIERSWFSILFAQKFIPIFTHKVSTLLQWKAPDRNISPSTSAVLISRWQQVNCSENTRGHFLLWLF